MLFSGHFVEIFELMAMELEKQNLQISALYRKLNNFLNPIMEFLEHLYPARIKLQNHFQGRIRAVLNYYLELKMGEISH